ncbi:MAG: methyltransferase [Erythrobacter sp.]|uniref:methyltransferase domain-containing protein n=1 Tax=Erythrobacter sp. TaxID=1042 RepID=UPI002621180E|nr:methyltransferase [Erythrobacter sp.]MDJ0977680.1 methyltransferase [Erythrobacter sp.]
MTTPSVPTIFNPLRRDRRLDRAVQREGRGDRARFVWQEMAEDVIERLGFVRHKPERALLTGAVQPWLAERLKARAVCVEPEAPYPESGYDFIGALGQFDAVNDLPGALIHIRAALVPGGLAIVSFIGGASLPRLRAAMMAAEPDRPAARMHPLVDPRAAPGLLQRAGWKDPVVDTHALKVRYSSLDRLVHDLRDQGLGSALADQAPPLNRAALHRARAAFLRGADEDGKVTETFEILTLTGRRSLGGT